MNSVPKYLPLILLALALNHNYTAAQRIHPLEPVEKHYEALLKYSSSPNSENADLDIIKWPMDAKVSGLQFVGIAPSYLSQLQVNQLKASISFPANSSDQTRAELDFLLAWEKKRTKKQEARAMDIAHIGYWPNLEKNSETLGTNANDLFWEGINVMGPTCTKENYPATLKLLAGVTRDMRIMEFTVKYHFLRARPYHLEPTLNPMARISSPSFASGHTLWGYIHAFIWSELIPEKRKEFLAIAFEVGESREIMGIHYPSDEEGARVLAHSMINNMWDNPEFIQDLKAAQAEWK